MARFSAMVLMAAAAITLASCSSNSATSRAASAASAAAAQKAAVLRALGVKEALIAARINPPAPKTTPPNLQRLVKALTAQKIQ